MNFRSPEYIMSFVSEYIVDFILGTLCSRPLIAELTPTAETAFATLSVTSKRTRIIIKWVCQIARFYCFYRSYIAFVLFKLQTFPILFCSHSDSSLARYLTITL